MIFSSLHLFSFFNSSFISHILDSAVLFVDACKVSPEVTEYMTQAGVQIKPYEEAISYVRAISENEDILRGNKIWCDGKTVNHAFYGSVRPAIRLDKESPITIMKSMKNEVKINVNDEIYHFSDFFHMIYLLNQSSSFFSSSLILSLSFSLSLFLCLPIPI